MKDCDGGRERGLSVLLALSLFWGPIATQRGAGNQGSLPSTPNHEKSIPAISVNVSMVVLHASVRDAKGQIVSDLQGKNFRVYEDGRPQTVELFHHRDVPVAVGLAVDNSGSMQHKRWDVTAAALAFVRSSNSEDEMFVVNCDENVTFRLPSIKPFSANPSELVHALMGAPAGGMTALYDAVTDALEHLHMANREKRALIVISDGGDNASRHSLNQVLQLARRSETIIYTIGLFGDDDLDANPAVLEKIASATGGEAFFPKHISTIVEICEEIAEDIRNQYTIGYSPANNHFDDRYRSIRVTAATPGGKKLRVRTRPGYIASSRLD